MNEYDFTLKYRLGDDDRDINEIIERLGAVGCTDALVGFGIVGRLALDFTREAENGQGAILSAISDVKRAIPKATLIEVTPDLVGLTDIACVLNIRRQNVRKAMENNFDFPAPVHEGNPAVWRLINVLDWYKTRKEKPFSTPLYEVTTCAAYVNVAIQAHRLQVYCGEMTADAALKVEFSNDFMVLLDDQENKDRAVVRTY